MKIDDYTVEMEKSQATYFKDQFRESAKNLAYDLTDGLENGFDWDGTFGPIAILADITEVRRNLSALERTLATMRGMEISNNFVKDNKKAIDHSQATTHVMDND